MAYPVCKETVNNVTNLMMNIACCKSDPTEIGVKKFTALSSLDTSSKESTEDFSNDESEFRTRQLIHKAYEPKFWSHVRIEKVD